MGCIRRVALVGLVALVTTSASGCFRYHTRIPGVLDMRSDASRAPSKTEPVLEGTDELSAYVQGHGVRSNGALVTVEHRTYWVVGSIPVVNSSAATAIDEALGGGSLREVVLEEEYSSLDWALGAVARFIIPPAAWITPSITHGLRGIRVLPARSHAARPRPARPFTPAPPPTPPPAPDGFGDDDDQRDATADADEPPDDEFVPADPAIPPPPTLLDKGDGDDK